MKHQMIFVMALLGIFTCISCAAGIKGQWNGSGNTSVGKIVQVELNFKENTQSTAQILTWNGYQHVIPICKFTMKDDSFSFVIESNASVSDCQNFEQPLLFRGTLGAHVMYGTIENMDGTVLGNWRAYRVEKKK